MNLAGGLSDLALPFDDLDNGHSHTLDLGRMSFCDPVATVVLGAFAATAQRKSQRPVQLQGWDPSSYLARVGFKPFAGYKDDYARKRTDSDRLTNLLEVRNADERGVVRDEVLDVLDIQHEGARDVLGYCLEEMLRNVEDHALSPVHALLQAQYYDNRHEVVMAIADTGRGVRQTLAVRHNVHDDETALKAALKPGVSGRNTRKGTNAGLGLTVSSALVSEVGGIFQVASGDCVVEVRRSGQAVYRIRNAPWPGVIVVMVVPRNDNLNWEGTFTKVMEGV
jgi:hypothetical protein